MVEELKLNAAKRFGTRYGRTVKQRFIEVEQLHRKLYKCEHCTKERVKRVAAGIWQCCACNTKFTGKAYTPSRLRFSQIIGAEKMEEDLLAPREKEENYNADEQADQTQIKEESQKEKKRRKKEKLEEQYKEEEIQNQEEDEQQDEESAEQSEDIPEDAEENTETEEADKEQ
jgi:large subunit ribosomal protein L37Ae